MTVNAYISVADDICIQCLAYVTLFFGVVFQPRVKMEVKLCRSESGSNYSRNHIRLPSGNIASDWTQTFGESCHRAIRLKSRLSQGLNNAFRRLLTLIVVVKLNLQRLRFPADSNKFVFWDCPLFGPNHPFLKTNQSLLMTSGMLPPPCFTVGMVLSGS